MNKTFIFAPSYKHFLGYCEQQRLKNAIYLHSAASILEAKLGPNDEVVEVPNWRVNQSPHFLKYAYEFIAEYESRKATSL